jgi:hypothetical protein
MPRQSCCRTAPPYPLVSFILKPSWKFFSVFGGLVINKKFAFAGKKKKRKRGVRFFSWPKINNNLRKSPRGSLCTSRGLLYPTIIFLAVLKSKNARGSYQKKKVSWNFHNFLIKFMEFE